MKVVYTYGAFDILHPGHIILLERAKKLGSYLIVGVVADAPIKELKGKCRPVMCVEDRMAIVRALRCVDEVHLQETYDPSNNLRHSLLHIDILAKGNDWDYIPGTETIQELGGKLIKLPYTKGHSTSTIIKKVRCNNDRRL